MIILKLMDFSVCGKQNINCIIIFCGILRMFFRKQASEEFAITELSFKNLFLSSLILTVRPQIFRFDTES